MRIRTSRVIGSATLEALVAGDKIRVVAALVTEADGDWVVVITVMN
jgi:hypothetical protein